VEVAFVALPAAFEVDHLRHLYSAVQRTCSRPVPELAASSSSSCHFTRMLASSSDPTYRDPGGNFGQDFFIPAGEI